MKFLIDTQVFIWFMMEPDKLSKKALKQIMDEKFQQYEENGLQLMW